MACGPAPWTKGAGSPRKVEESPMMTGPPAPDDRRGEDPLEAKRARLAALWALVLGRFRAYAHGNGGATVGRDGHEEGR